MRRFPRKLATLGVALIPLVAGGFLLQSRAERQGDRLLDQVFSYVQSRFVDQVSTQDLYEKAARGLVEELNDPYSELLAPKDLKRFQASTGGKYGGVGMQIEDQQGWITVQTVFPHTPAERQGVRVGDRIVFADSLGVRGWSLSQTSEYITGTPGTKVTITFARPGVTEPIRVTFTREVIHVPAVPYAIMLDNRIGYLKLQRFNESAAADVERSIRDLTRQGARSILLDLRENPGGILEQSLEVSNLFLKRSQPILSVRGRVGNPVEYAAQADPVLPSLPLVVLTDEQSASASEIVAGALQDHDRAVIIGQTTFGKGLVQSVFPLDGGYALKLTTAKWYTPSGRSIQKDRKIQNGRMVAEVFDSTETEAAKKNRPAYKSDAGRIVYGGGGITPDIIVPDDTLSTLEQQVARATFVGPKQVDAYVALHDYALELSRQVRPDFQVQPGWRDELYRRLQAKGVTVDRAQWNAASRYVDTQLEQRVTRLAFGDSTAKRRSLKYDAPLRKAIEVANRGQTQKDLFTIAAAEAAAHPAVTTRRP
ncbi:MAG: S41 family peptidase [Gemmatimonadota bacterium]|nr:S41 family peptidase [Gemmatimonadota bacterium]